jgi:RNA polymerase sigma-70 factor (ECF subfamily)
MEVLAAASANMDATDLQRELGCLHAASFGWALSCCRHRRDEAEDVLHTAYLKVLEGKAQFEGRSSFRTWFFGVIRHTASEQRRRQWLRDTLLKRWFSGESWRSNQPAETTETSMGGALLRNALEHLAERQRQVLHLVFYQDLTVEEASEVLGVSLGTARTHFDRGKRRLRELLAPEEVADAKRQ